MESQQSWNRYLKPATFFVLIVLIAAIGVPYLSHDGFKPEAGEAKQPTTVLVYGKEGQPLPQVEIIARVHSPMDSGEEQTISAIDAVSTPSPSRTISYYTNDFGELSLDAFLTDTIVSLSTADSELDATLLFSSDSEFIVAKPTADKTSVITSKEPASTTFSSLEVSREAVSSMSFESGTALGIQTGVTNREVYLSFTQDNIWQITPFMPNEDGTLAPGGVCGVGAMEYNLDLSLVEVSAPEGATCDTFMAMHTPSGGDGLAKGTSLTCCLDCDSYDCDLLGSQQSRSSCDNSAIKICYTEGQLWLYCACLAARPSPECCGAPGTSCGGDNGETGGGGGNSPIVDDPGNGNGGGDECGEYPEQSPPPCPGTWTDENGCVHPVVCEQPYPPASVLPCDGGPDLCYADSQCPGEEECCRGLCVESCPLPPVCSRERPCPEDECCIGGGCVDDPAICDPTEPCIVGDDLTCPGSDMCCEGLLFGVPGDCEKCSPPPGCRGCTPCETDNDCEDPEACVDGLCQLPHECNTNEDCSNAECCIGDLYNYCNTTCVQPICLNGDVGQSCGVGGLKCCGPDLYECRQDYENCTRIACVSNDDCPEDFECNLDNNTCEPSPPPPTPSPTPGECSSSADCEVRECCLDNSCVEKDDCGETPVRCTLRNHCENGECCVSEECTTDCGTGTCEGDEDCPNGKHCKDGQCIDDCTSDADCPGDEVCDAGRCRPTGGCDDCKEWEECRNNTCQPKDCENSSQCPVGSTCENGTCQPPGGCDSNFDCSPGHYCEGGICKPTACPTGVECPSDFECVDGTCRPTGCDDDDDCPGERCNPDTRTCEPTNPCTLDDDCPSGYYCNTNNNTCTPSGSCENDSQCPGGCCRGGTCIGDCGSGTSCTSDLDCEAGECCENELCTTECGGTQCESNSDCSLDQCCNSGTCGTCESGSCEVGADCDSECCVENLCAPPSQCSRECQSHSDCPGQYCCQGACQESPCTYGDCPTVNRYAPDCPQEPIQTVCCATTSDGNQCVVPGTGENLPQNDSTDCRAYCDSLGEQSHCQEGYICCAGSENPMPDTNECVLPGRGDDVSPNRDLPHPNLCLYDPSTNYCPTPNEPEGCFGDLICCATSDPQRNECVFEGQGDPQYNEDPPCREAECPVAEFEYFDVPIEEARAEIKIEFPKYDELSDIYEIDLLERLANSFTEGEALELPPSAIKLVMDMNIPLPGRDETFISGRQKVWFPVRASEAVKVQDSLRYVRRNGRTEQYSLGHPLWLEHTGRRQLTWLTHLQLPGYNYQEDDLYYGVNVWRRSSFTFNSADDVIWLEMYVYYHETQDDKRVWFLPKITQKVFNLFGNDETINFWTYQPAYTICKYTSAQAVVDHLSRDLVLGHYEGQYQFIKAIEDTLWGLLPGVGTVLYYRQTHDVFGTLVAAGGDITLVGGLAADSLKLFRAAKILNASAIAVDACSITYEGTKICQGDSSALEAGVTALSLAEYLVAGVSLRNARIRSRLEARYTHKNVNGDQLCEQPELNPKSDCTGTCLPSRDIIEQGESYRTRTSTGVGVTVSRAEGDMGNNILLYADVNGATAGRFAAMKTGDTLSDPQMHILEDFREQGMSGALYDEMLAGISEVESVWAGTNYDIFLNGERDNPQSGYSYFIQFMEHQEAVDAAARFVPSYRSMTRRGFDADVKYYPDSQLMENTDISYTRSCPFIPPPLDE